MLPFQEYMIVAGAAAAGRGGRAGGIERARPTDAVLAALAEAELIVIGPSNPVISIGPILALPGMREALAGAPAPVVAVSPFVGGRSLKGPTEHFCAWAGIETSAAGHRAGVRRGGRRRGGGRARRPDLVTDTLMDGPRAHAAAGTKDPGVWGKLAG